MENQVILKSKFFEIGHAEQSFVTALLTNDTPLLDWLTAENFKTVDHLGRVLSKPQFLSDMSRDQRVKKRTVISNEIVVTGSTALILAKLEIEMDKDGKAFVGTVQNSRVWSLTPEGWKTILLHSTDTRVVDSWDSLKNRADKK